MAGTANRKITPFWRRPSSRCPAPGTSHAMAAATAGGTEEARTATASGTATSVAQLRPGTRRTRWSLNSTRPAPGTRRRAPETGNRMDRSRGGHRGGVNAGESARTGARGRQHRPGVVRERRHHVGRTHRRARGGCCRPSTNYSRPSTRASWRPRALGSQPGCHRGGARVPGLGTRTGAARLPAPTPTQRASRVGRSAARSAARTPSSCRRGSCPRGARAPRWPPRCPFAPPPSAAGPSPCPS